MSRRSATLAVSGLLLIAMVFAVLTTAVPYGELSPGPTVNTLSPNYQGKPVIEVEGHETFPASGHLNMTTVSVTSKSFDMPLFQAFIGWAKDDADVVKKNDLYPDDKTEKQVEEENAEEFTSSQQHAKVAAFDYLYANGLISQPVTRHIIVKTVSKDMPATGKLHAGDIILSIDGTPIKTTGDVGAAITKHKAGETVRFVVDPEDARGTQRTIDITTTAAPQDGHAVVGITPGVLPEFPFKVTIHLEDVGGPSAGLMFALGIVDILSPGDLTGGKFVAGTGTIDDDGGVGPIGGVQMKTIAAQRAGAKYFLTPADNCSEAVKNKPGGLTLVRVESLNDALNALKVISSGQGTLTECTADTHNG
ncbi:YlbL family protein [Yinghuangia seranimata]|uniref:YlbL family protein n=1 Tax=Yinghuangia seranimata TaxID=408067 RepID=UPI00248ADB4A|nr:PDZ domain-containing protein [Yinghuangia seranimata]MDI2128034.1 PDZ domain-containing protein [Yinghuangia seranimata]